MIQLNIMGRLENQMFQYACARALQEKVGVIYDVFVKDDIESDELRELGKSSFEDHWGQIHV